MKNRHADAMATTYDWARVGSSVAVWALGSCEQHGPHLPLSLDTILADHFARVVAESLEAAQLPTLPILQCTEHSGFRRSVGLHPETAMALIRDVAESLEAQHFRRLILINGHGGNQAIPPTVRDWNSRDRPLRILLMNWYEWDTSREGAALREGQLHADAWETSVALALCPELVGDYRALGPAPAPWPACVSDLNHFGISALRPMGYWGDPSRASAEAGRAIVHSVERNLVEAIQERLSWMERESRYTGKGAWVIRPLHRAELEQGWRLAQAAGWNQPLEDWLVMQTLWPETILGAIRNGQVVGTTVLAVYDRTQAWVAMVLVDPHFRRMGIASALVQRAIELAPPGSRIGLDATPDGREVYYRLGFRSIGVRRRMAIAAAPSETEALGGVRPMTAADLPAVAACDEIAFGASRLPLLRQLHAARPSYGFVADQGGTLKGFVLGRSGLLAEHVGPLVADDLSTARALASAVFRAMAGRPVFLDVPEEEREWQGWLEAKGFRTQRHFTRMGLGEDVWPAPGEMRCYGIAGPEFG